MSVYVGMYVGIWRGCVSIWRGCVSDTATEASPMRGCISVVLVYVGIWRGCVIQRIEASPIERVCQCTWVYGEGVKEKYLSVRSLEMLPLKHDHRRHRQELHGW